jgi:hypothetical protein
MMIRLIREVGNDGEYSAWNKINGCEREESRRDCCCWLLIPGYSQQKQGGIACAFTDTVITPAKQSHTLKASSKLTLWLGRHADKVAPEAEHTCIARYLRGIYHNILLQGSATSATGVKKVNLVAWEDAYIAKQRGTSEGENPTCAQHWSVSKNLDDC